MVQVKCCASEKLHLPKLKNKPQISFSQDESHKDAYGSPHPAHGSSFFKPGSQKLEPHQDAYSPPPHGDGGGGGYEAPPNDDHGEGDGYTGMPFSAVVIFHVNDVRFHDRVPRVLWKCLITTG